MKNELGFDTDRYLKHQIEKLSQRLSRFDRLYLEFGGKLFSDFHATRILPGYRSTAKIELLKEMGSIELFYCVSAKDIERGKIRGDSGLSYDLQTLKDIKDIKNFGVPVSGVVITLFTGQPSAEQLKRKLKNLGYKVYFQNVIDGYPREIDKVLSGYNDQPYIKTTKKLVVVTGAGGGSGKMALCLSQIFHEKSKKLNSGYAKFETFPIWDLPVEHPINITYEAATADLGDFNIVDRLHKKEYGVIATNYNRDMENFRILKSILTKITGEKHPYDYRSPTDMGVNALSSGIINDEVCKIASFEEIIRRFYVYSVEKIEGKETQKTIDRMIKIMNKANLKPEDRLVVTCARKAENEAIESKNKGFKGIYCGSAIELKNGKIISGKNSPILHSESAAILNTLKYLSNIPDETNLISPEILKIISEMKNTFLGTKSPSLSVDETLIVLASCAVSNQLAKSALSKVGELRNCEMHSTYILSPGDAEGLRNLGINATSDPRIPPLDF